VPLAAAVIELRANNRKHPASSDPETAGICQVLDHEEAIRQSRMAEEDILVSQ
jgi:hypothetical protein